MYCQQVGQGAPVAMLHGWGWHGDVWGHDFVRALVEQGLQLNQLDLPGHGRSVPQYPFSLDNIVQGLVTCLDETDAVPVTLMGWSLGGLLAMKLALDWPERVARLILINTTPCYGQRPDWPHAMTRAELDRFNHNLDLDPQRTLVRFLGLQLPAGNADRKDWQLLRQLMFLHGEPDIQTLKEAMTLLVETDFRNHVRGLRQPVLLLHGGADQLVPLSAAQWLADTLPDARLEIIKSGGHLVFRHQVQKLAATIGSFVTTMSMK